MNIVFTYIGSISYVIAYDKSKVNKNMENVELAICTKHMS